MEDDKGTWEKKMDGGVIEDEIKNSENESKQPTNTSRRERNTQRIIELISGTDRTARRSIKVSVIDFPTVGPNKGKSPAIIKETSSRDTESDASQEVTLAKDDVRGETNHSSWESEDGAHCVYPEIEMLSDAPFPLNFHKIWSDRELENWAASSQRKREAERRKLTVFLLKREVKLLSRLPFAFNSLSCVDLSYNDLTDISPLCALPTITHLDVSHNKLKQLLNVYPEFYWNLDDPDELNVDENVSKTMSQLSTRGWCLCGSGVSRLQWVNYSHNLVTRLGGPRHWNHFPRLIYLDLSHNRISDLRSEDSCDCSTPKYTECRGGAECGLEKLSLLHTLDLSQNFISQVEGFNGLHVHNLILSRNAISRWEGEKGPLYENKDLKRSPSQNVSKRKEGRASSRIEERVDNPTFSKEVLTDERADDASSGHFQIPSFRVIRKRFTGFKEEKEKEKAVFDDNGTEEAPESMAAKEMEVLYPIEQERKKEELPMEVLYDSRGRKEHPYLCEDASSEDGSRTIDQWLEEDNIFENWYDSDVKFVHFPERVNYSEDELRSSSEERESREVARKVTSDACEKDSDESSISKMFDGDLEGQGEPSDAEGNLRNGGRMGVATHQEREYKAEVLHDRSRSWEGGEEGDEVAERIYEEWDDPEVRVLHWGRVEEGGDDASGDDVSSEGLGGGKEEEGVVVLYSASYGVLYEGTEEEPGGEGVEVSHVRGEGRPETVADEELECRSLEVLFFGSGGSEGSASEGREEEESEGEAEEISEPLVPSGAIKSFAFDVYQRILGPDSEEGGVAIEREGDALASEGEAKEAAGGTLSRREVDDRKRDETNALEDYVGLRSLLWLVELHLEHNEISSLKMFRGMYCLRSLYIQYNRIEEIGELIFLSELHRLRNLDMTGNPVSNCNGFTNTVLFLHPSIRYLNNVDCSSSAGRSRREPTNLIWKNPFFRAARQAEDLLLASESRRDNYVRWSSRELESLVCLHSAYPTLLLVGPEGSGKTELCQLLCDDLPDKCYLSPLYTTKPSDMPDGVHLTTPTEREEDRKRCPSLASHRTLRYVTEKEFVRLMCSGAIASASDDEGFFYGFEKRSLHDAARKDNVLVAAVNLTTALALRMTRFGGGARLVLVLPESNATHEKNLRRKFSKRRIGATREDTIPRQERHHEDNVPEMNGCLWDGEGDYGAEEEYLRRNLKAREECLTTHRGHPGIFEFGLFCDDKITALKKLKDLVEAMHGSRTNYSLFDEEGGMSAWHRASVPQNLMSKINERFEKELESGPSVWE